jgi:Mg2+-importing ATPase
MTGWKTWLVLALVILFIGLFAAGHAADVRVAARLLQTARPWPLVAALSFQALYYVFAALVVRQCLHLVDYDAPFGWTLQATFLLIFFSRIVPGPAATGPAALYYLLERRGVQKARSAIVGPLFFAVDYGVFFVLAAVGLAALVLRGGSGAVAKAAVPGLCALFLGFAAVPVLLSRPGALEAALAWLARGLNYVFRLFRVKARISAAMPCDVMETISEMRRRLRSHPHIGILLACFGLTMVLCDVASMACSFLAFGVWVGVPVAFLGYCLSTVGAMVSVLPGGLGTFDAAMVLGFTGLGVPRAAALAATLAYRIIATWLPALLGMAAWRAVAAPAGRQ